ncbi:M15 family metallopeptidase [Streptomyces sp. NBC_00063]|uniref:M15 family metallopeptidase n=1 Tax=Streptomyces sp. NBC_00063 TaxID=2975638 RepID=UPI0022579D08|nr:M15 family metallopeptidase [Streptomyces sp. NBC_00063]MCX5442599.1 M15 family metallopeptidase [Streptomyces sp. NBC_00063]
MTRPPPAAEATTRRVRRLLVVGPAVVMAAIAAACGYQPRNSSASSSISSSSPEPPSKSSSAVPPPSSSAAVPPSKAPRRDDHETLGKAGGLVPDGVAVSDDAIPAVANLDPDLLKALRQAATDAADDGVEFVVNSGWRSPNYQSQLLREAVSKYGSEAEAARWVATAVTSPHVSGDAVGIGHSDATTWLSDHGAEYGLCRIYKNEPWHYELRPEAIDDGCPRMYADPTQDPRMQQ